MRLPDHACSLTLEHNPNRDFYQTVAEHIADGRCDHAVFKDEDAKRRCIEANELWTLQWYPRTPIGFIAVAAPTLAELLELAAVTTEP